MKPGLYQAGIESRDSAAARKERPPKRFRLSRTPPRKSRKSSVRTCTWPRRCSRAGEFAKAEQSYKAALEIDPKSPDAELGLAQALVKQDRVADAAPHFQNAAALNPNYRDALLELASLYEAAEKAGRSHRAVPAISG